MSAQRATRVCLGRAAGARGIRGEVRVTTFTADPLDFARYGVLEDERGERSFEIESVSPARDGVTARVRGITTREQAEALKGTEFWVDRAQLPDLDDGDDYYYADLVGLVALNAEGSALGQVVSVQNFGAGDLLEVRPATGGKTVLVPFTKEIVPDIDREAGWLLVVPPEGLFGD